MGNTDFNISEATPSNTLGAPVDAMGAITREDMDLEMMLERAHRAEEPTPQFDDEPAVELKALKMVHNLLSEEMDIEPAKTINELNEQVHYAKELGCDSIEATPTLVKSLNRQNYSVVEKIGFFLYHDIKVFIDGKYEASRKILTQTTEQILFGGSKLALTPIMNEDKNK